MQVDPLQRSVKATDMPLEQLVHNTHVTKDEKVKAACRAFEAVLLRQILESSQKTVIASNFNKESSTSAIYRDLVTNQMADNVSRSGQFGLARTLLDQLKSRTHPGPADAGSVPEGPGSPKVSSTGKGSAAGATPPSPAASSELTKLKPFHIGPILKAYRHE